VGYGAVAIFQRNSGVRKKNRTCGGGVLFWGSLTTKERQPHQRRKEGAEIKQF